MNKKYIAFKSLLFVPATILYVDTKYLKGVGILHFLEWLCTAFSTDPSAGRYAAFCVPPYLNLNDITALSQIVFLTALIVLFANRRGLTRWLLASPILISVTAFFVYATASSSSFVDSNSFIGFDGPITLGYDLYLPATLFIVAVSYLPQRIRKRPRETTSL